MTDGGQGSISSDFERSHLAVYGLAVEAYKEAMLALPKRGPGGGGGITGINWWRRRGNGMERFFSE